MRPKPDTKRPRRRRWRVIRIAVGLLAAAVVVPVIVALVGVAIECRPWSSAGVPPSIAVQPATAGLKNYARSEDQTYLTLPEWYIVYSADEYAAFVAHNPPSQFSYFGAVGQFWGSYYDVCAVTRDQYTFNGGYHLSLVVIGISFTAEDILKGLYEHSIGWLTEAISSPALTEEDHYAQAVAVEYGTFIHTIPWYEFPFGSKLRGLWRDTPLWGPNIIRKWERKGVLSLEYGIKATYGWVIGQGTQSVYATEDLEIYAWVEGMTPAILQQEPKVRLERSVDSNASIVAIPRYEAFTEIVPRLAQAGVQFVEIAGNNELLVTLIAPQDWKYDLPAGHYLFAMPILTEPDKKRVAINVPIKSLQQVLRDLSSRDVVIEHLYDY